MHTWQLQEAKAKLSEVITASQNAPQAITVRGEEKSVLLSKHDYLDLQLRAAQTNRSSKNPGSFGAYLAKTPLCGANLQIDRNTSPFREPEW